ncbi:MULTISPECIES: GIY-YIG nuclease family protein [unclassified Modestobacter]|uniref:GIY-YIG nuclease family protein n=1 Tax=unclassified Modestobacter TaxID=2643866 RepID=UPI002F26587B
MRRADLTTPSSTPLAASSRRRGRFPGTASKATLRSRVAGDHIRGTTGSSTLRRSLAALQSEREGWQSRWTTRPVLVSRDQLRLSEWSGRS